MVELDTTEKQAVHRMCSMTIEDRSKSEYMTENTFEIGNLGISVDELIDIIESFDSIDEVTHRDIEIYMHDEEEQFMSDVIDEMPIPLSGEQVFDNIEYKIKVLANQAQVISLP